MTKHRIAYMADPPVQDKESAIIVAVHAAREYLALAERAADRGDIYYPGVLSKVHSADDLLGTAVVLCQEVGPIGTKRAQGLLLRARESARAAYHQGTIARSYASMQRPSPFEKKQADKTRGILRRAAESAKQETHRALAELADIFPDAYDVEGEDAPPPHLKTRCVACEGAGFIDRGPDSSVCTCEDCHGTGTKS